MEMDWILLLRLILASFLGGIIGVDREFRAKEAGIRTHFLVCLGSALLMIVSQHGFGDVVGQPGYSLDVSRVAAQVVSGIGFIGAGMIIIQKQSVVGLTSAAGIWATSGIGLAVGGGMYWISVSATILTLVGFELSNLMFRKIEHHTTSFQISTTKADSLPKITELMQSKQKIYQTFESKREIFEETKVYHVSFTIRTKNYEEEMELVQALQELPHVTVEKIN
ncbi:methyltransferase [Carnobacterium divergens]|uniref:MgtC/SapB family protein n=1 Tax=Carnobacterium divergens TaxID=2748 RepID=UPI001073A2FE|nr:methyltransferase [Carnobacterium divergens]